MLKSALKKKPRLTLMNIAKRLGIMKPVPRHIQISNTSKVRNSYENTDPVTGQSVVTHNNYPVNTGDKERLKKNVWTTNNPQSSAVRAHRLMGPNSDLGPALSSVGEPFLGITHNNAISIRAYKKKYGSKWVNAMAEREQALANYQEGIANANKIYYDNLIELEKSFLEDTGLYAPTLIERLKESDLQYFLLEFEQNTIDFNTYERETNEIHKIADDAIAALPEDKKVKFMKNVNELEAQLKTNIGKVDALRNEFREEFRTFTPGEPIVARNRTRTLNKRLANAESVFKGEGKKGGRKRQTKRR